MLLPNLTHAALAKGFVEMYRKNFKVIRTKRKTIEVWVKGDDRKFFEPDLKKYYLQRSSRTYLNWVFFHSPEPKPAELESHGFLTNVMREAVTLLYDRESSL